MNKLYKKLGVGFLISVTLVLMMSGLAQAYVTGTVRSGDSLYIIANRYGVSVSDLKSANGLTSDAIYPGQSLVIPSAGTSTGNSYTVAPGDSLYLISQRFGVSVDSIRRTNKLWKDVVYPGQVLNIPGGSSRQEYTVSRDFSRSELDLLARVVYAEARGEEYKGQVAVAAVILNRINNPNFPHTISGVIYAPYAFSCVEDGQINLAADATAYKAVQDALKGWDPTYGALYYWNPATATSPWVWSRPITTQIGNHVFAK